MPNASQNFFVRPLFIHALSGEFQPPGDVLNRSHTLGFLALGALEEGSIDFETATTATGATLYQSTYTPPWAPEVTAKALFTLSGSVRRIAGLRLSLASGIERLTVTDVTGHSKQVLMDLETCSEVTPERFTLNLGQYRDIPQQKVTEAAQTFFQATLSPQQKR